MNSEGMFVVMPSGEQALLFSDKVKKLFSLLGALCFFLCPPVYAHQLQVQPHEAIPLQLSQMEQDWLKDHPVIRVASDPSWRPLEYQDSNGEFKGVAIDYLRKIENLLGVQFEIVSGYRWAELVERSKARELDMFSCITQTPDREKYLTFTRPYLSFPATIFTRHEAPFVGDLRELANEKVAVVDGYAFHEFIARDHPEIILVPVESVLQGLQMLESGEVSAFVGNLLVAGYHITAQGYIHLKVAGETPYRNDLGLATRSDWPELAGILQKALDSISPEEKREIYKNWVSLTYEHKFDRTLLFQTLAVIITIFALILIVIQQRQLKARKKSVLQIARHKAEFEAVFNAITDALIFVDPQRRIIMTNNAFVEVFGYSFEQVKGETTECLYADPELYKEAGGKRFSSDAKNDQPVYEMNYRRKDGSVFPGETMGVKVTDTSGALIGFLGVSRDITERKQVEEQLLQNDRIKSEFIATASHELRTPLTVILGYTELLMKNNSLSPDSRQNALACIFDKGLVLERMVDDLLDISWIEAGRKIFLELAFVRIYDVVEQIIRQFEQEVRNCTFSMHFPDKEVVLLIDRGRMVQVLENLISNAVKFSPEGGEIVVKGETFGADYQVAISDEGIGMDAEQRERMFDKFYRADSSPTAARGLGLGLYLVKNIIEAHHGRIWVESEPGRGTTVNFAIPLPRT
ncbi:MAG: transporter substrate-binding domain-containing protein [Desulfuromonadales bacterium]|nr:transporter substrate-binding domain-containing protein [Desulfuromonadales bacterium]